MATAATKTLPQGFKAAAVKPVKTPPIKVEAAVRKPSIQTVQTGLSSRQETDRTTPYVLIRKQTGTGKPQRQIVNFIEVKDTQDASHVRSMRVAIVEGYAFGTNLNQGTIDLRKARVFAYSRRLMHGKTAKTVMPWDVGNETAIRSLQLLGLITQYELEFHLATTADMKADADKAAAIKAKAAQAKSDLDVLTRVVKGALKTTSVQQVRAALKKASAKIELRD